MSADNCGYCGASLIYMDGTYVCPDCTLTLGEQREIRRYIRDNNTPHNELPVWLVSLIARAEAAEARAERYEDALQQIHNWAIAYPLDVFPEPDFRRVREVLEAAGITLDSVSASNMRHVISGVARIVENALKGGEE